MMRFEGYYRSSELPFKQGQKVVIPAGTRVSTMYPGQEPYRLSRQQTITIHHFLPGMSVPVDHAIQHYPNVLKERGLDPEALLQRQREDRDSLIAITNPHVAWPGKGGYWCEVELNDILAANGIVDKDQVASETGVV